MRLKFFGTIGAAAIMALGLFAAGSASAATLQFSNPGSTTARAQVDCSFCEVWYISGSDYSAENWGNGFWNGEGPGPDGTLFSRSLVSGTGNDDTSRRAITNLVLGTNFVATDRTETGGNASVWTSSAEALLVWIGTQGNPSSPDVYRYAFIRNQVADNTFTWTGLSGGGGGKSGYDGFGTVSPVPLPAAAWMLLAGLGGLFLVKRRTNAAV
ncbi:VPLPA-CTERM sorting domain-containing protein [Roseovarius sp. PS-C2]|uniref:VPLPA-CTERM sorting domain-containing protein n=1 Tax=Roseovarius sp. PS-C2 TaxID=2820814 RepID=UPI00209ABFC3|nr:VPLPA-CTERM sorting domain-containing protein [Roseovarius sp. PS-C2]